MRELKLNETQLQILRILSKYRKMRGIDIRGEIESSRRISKQGLHKTLRQMKGHGIVEKNSFKYEISRDWLQNMRDFFGEL